MAGHRRHLSFIHCLLPRSSGHHACMTSMATPRSSPPSARHSIALSSRSKGDNAEAPLPSSLRRARACSMLHHCPPKFASSSTMLCSLFSTLKFAVKPSGELAFPTIPKSGHQNSICRQAQCWVLPSPSLPSVHCST